MAGDSKAGTHLAAGEGALALGSSAMCKECYLHFMEATGGLDQDGANPPAFIAAQNKEALVSDDSNALQVVLRGPMKS